MKAKRFLSTVVAGALVAAQMAMPVMAADGGQVDVDVTTKTGVLRVQVPTSMAIAVDQFEITQVGAQIASGEFDMTNLSEMDVKVTVASTATLGTGITLVDSFEKAETSEGDEVWLAVAAKTAASSYDDASTDDAAEDYWNLTEANMNVTTFASDTKKAEQTFYLAKGTGSAAYTLAVPDANNKVTASSYAQFYELTAIGTQPTDDDELQAEVDKADVYVVVTANAGDDEATVTKLEKGSTVSAGTYASTNTYYTAAIAPTAAASLANGKLYTYAAMGTAGGAAGFTYVGKLSNARETWTATDISKVSIAYTITGVTASKYDEVKDDCTYGLYAEQPSGPQVTLTADGTITMSGLTADINYAHSAILAYGQRSDELDSDPNMEWGLENWSEEEGGTLVFKLSPAWLAALDGLEATVTVKLTDDTTMAATQQF